MYGERGLRLVIEPTFIVQRALITAIEGAIDIVAVTSDTTALLHS